MLGLLTLIPLYSFIGSTYPHTPLSLLLYINKVQCRPQTNIIYCGTSFVTPSASRHPWITAEPYIPSIISLQFWRYRCPSGRFQLKNRMIPPMTRPPRDLPAGIAVQVIRGLDWIKTTRTMSLQIVTNILSGYVYCTKWLCSLSNTLNT